MEGMSQTDGVRVAVTGANDHMDIFIGAFDALGKGSARPWVVWAP